MEKSEKSSEKSELRQSLGALQHTGINTTQAIDVGLQIAAIVCKLDVEFILSEDPH